MQDDLYLQKARRYQIPLVKNGYSITNDIPSPDVKKLCMRCSEYMGILQPFIACCLCKSKIHWTCLLAFQRKAFIEGQMDKNKWYCMSLTCLQQLGESSISVENITKKFIEKIYDQM